MSYPPWTSIQAFLKLLPEISGDRRIVLSWLVEHHNEKSVNPTARELAAWVSKTRRNNAPDLIRDVGRRLPEIADRWSAIHRGVTRKCNTTGNEAFTWVLGPEPGKSLTLKRKKKRKRFTPQQILQVSGVNPGAPVSMTYDKAIAMVAIAVNEGANYPK